MGPVLYGLRLDRWRKFQSVPEGDDIFQKDLDVSLVLGHVAFSRGFGCIISESVAAVKSDIKWQVLMGSVR